MERRLLLVGTTLALLLASSGSALAGPGYYYDWTPNPATIQSNTPGQGTINLQSTGSVLGVASTNVIAAQVWVTSIQHFDMPAQFTNAAYTLSLKLTDEPSGQSGVFTFQGLLNGTAWKHGSLITNTFVGPTTETMVLGNEQYTVALGSFVPPGPPGPENAGTIGATITMQPLSTQATPEPSTLALAGLGLVLTGLTTWRKRRRPALAI
jgi:PEP-CTERM motif